MSMKKNFLSVGVLLLTLVFLAGCSNKNAPMENGSDISTGAIAPIEKSPVATESAPTEQIELVPATGKVSDIASAVEKDAADEKTEVLNEESDAKAAISTDEETSDFGQIYDENEF